MQESLKRIEDKLDKLIETRDNHNARLTSLETQAGFIKSAIAAAITIGGIILSYISKQVKG